MAERQLHGRSGAALRVCAAGLVGLTILGLMMPHSVPGRFGIGYGVALDHFMLLVVCQGIVYGGAVFFLLRGGAGPSLWLVFGVAALLRLPVLAVPPFLSNDMFRYIWDGWVQAHGINPYRYIPANPHLAFLRDAIVYPNINRANYAHTIYPPAAQLLFLLITRIGTIFSLPPVLAMKCGMLAFEALGMFAIVKLLQQAGLPRGRSLIYAWNPIPVWEFAGSGHVDALAVCFVALSLLAASQKRAAAAGAALAVAMLIKLLPLALLPALWRRGKWRLPAVFVAVAAALYLPYLGAGHMLFGFFSGYAAEEKIIAGTGLYLPDLLHLTGTGLKLYFALILIGLAALGLAVFLRPARDVQDIAGRAALLAGATILAISPHYPWYYAWLLVPACIIASPALIYLTTSSVLLYLDPTHTGLFWQSWIFLPSIALGAAEIIWRRRQSQKF